MRETKVLQFESNASFRSEQSVDFSSLLLGHCDLPTRTHICESYGLGFVGDGRTTRIAHDGRKVGIGFFRTEDLEVTFSILPKEHVMRLEDMFRALGEENVQRGRARLEYLDSLAPVEEGTDDLTPTFLLSLLKDIVDFAAHLNITVYQKREHVVVGGLRGRPKFHKAVPRMLLGRSQGWICEILDDGGLRLYLSALLATAKDVVQVLGRFRELLLAAGEAPITHLNSIIARFGMRDTSDFSLGLLLKLAMPPFPFGLKDIIYRCLRYWRWRGNIRIDPDGLSTSRYHGMVVQMDRLYQDYVGVAWSKALGDSGVWYPSLSLPYELRTNEDCLIGTRTLVPDHLIWVAASKTALILDAKYSTEVGQEDHIYQVMAYANYRDLYSVFPEVERRVGLLVYPSDTWNVTAVSGFSHDLYLVRMPIESNPDLPQTKQRILQLFERLSDG